jgi:hypothetical protein
MNKTNLIIFFMLLASFCMYELTESIPVNSTSHPYQSISFNKSFKEIMDLLREKYLPKTTTSSPNHEDDEDDEISNERGVDLVENENENEIFDSEENSEFNSNDSTEKKEEIMNEPRDDKDNDLEVSEPDWLDEMIEEFENAGKEEDADEIGENNNEGNNGVELPILLTNNSIRVLKKILSNNK